MARITSLLCLYYQVFYREGTKRSKRRRKRREYLYTIFLAEGGRGRNFPARSGHVSINKPPENGFVTLHHLARTKLACGAPGRCWERN